MNKKLLIYLLPLFTLLDSISNGLFNPVLTKILIYGGAQTTAFPTVYIDDAIFGSAFVFSISPVYFFASPLLGLLSDHLGRRKLLLFCATLSALGYLLNYISIKTHIFNLLILGNFFTSISHTSLVIVFAAISDIAQGKRQLFSFSLVCLALFLILPISGFSTLALQQQQFATTSVELISLLAFFMPVLNIALVKWFIPETTPPAKFSLFYRLQSLPIACFEMLSKRSIQIFLFMLMVMHFAWGALLQEIPLLLEQNNYLALSSSMLNSYLVLWVAVGLFVLLPWLYQKFELYHSLLIGFGLAWLGMIMLLILNKISAYHGLFMLPAISGTTVLMPLLWLCVAKRAPKHARGLWLGLSNSGRNLSWVLGGALTNISFAWSSTVSLLIVTIVLTFSLMLLMKRVLIKRNPGADYAEN